MTPYEAAACVRRLTDIWPRATMTEGTAREYMKALVSRDHDEMQDSIDTLAKLNRFMPTIAELMGGADRYLNDEGDEISETEYFAQQLGRSLREQTHEQPGTSNPTEHRSGSSDPGSGAL